MKKSCPTGLGKALGGACALIVVMGIGRFAYTSLLPGMMTAYGFGEDVAGIMAAWNYGGYLMGVLLMRKEKAGQRRFNRFVIFLGLSLMTTMGMGLTSHKFLWYTLRGVAGIASGACFVLCSSIVLDTLIALNRPHLSGLFYSGVGVGIAFSALVSIPLATAGGPPAAWLGLAALGLPLAGSAVLTLRPGPEDSLPLPHNNGASSPGEKGQRDIYRLLLCAYFLEGFGYIIGTTFLVSLVQNTTNSPALAQAAWIVTGCAAALSTPLWRMAAGKGYLPMLILAFVLQGAGVLLPVLWGSTAAALTGGLLLGGTFMGITVLSLQYGVGLSGKGSAHTVAVMTALYGIGQILGPCVAGGKGFSLAFVVAGLSLFLGAGLLLAAHTLLKD